MAFHFIDHAPCIVPAGNVILNKAIDPNKPVETVKDCLTYVSLAEKLNELKKLCPPIPEEDHFKCKPIITKDRYGEIGKCLALPVKTSFQLLQNDVDETVYDSFWNRRTGKGRDPIPYLPKNIRLDATFGKPTARSESAGPIIHPRISSGELIYADKKNHDLYVFSHEDYYGGERINRKYDAPFSSDSCFGVKTPYDASGKKAKQCLTWYNNLPTTSVSRRQANHKNRMEPSIGKGCDRTGVGDIISPDVRFGITSSDDQYNATELIPQRPISHVRRDMDKFISAANSLRFLVKKKISEGLFTIYDIECAFKRLDKEKTEIINIDKLVEVCRTKFLFQVNLVLIEPLLVILGLLNPDRTIKLFDFLDFLDVNVDFPPLKRSDYILPPDYKSLENTYVSQLPTPECKCRALMDRPAGIAFVRYDIKYPFRPGTSSFKADEENLYTETCARTVLSPSIYTQYGLTHRDFFKPRSKEFISMLFKRTGVILSEEEFNELYEEALKLDDTGGVCVETFRGLLDKKTYENYIKINND